MRTAPLITSRCIFTPLNVTHLTGKFPCHILIYMLLQKHLPTNHTSTVGHHHVLRRLVIVVIEHLLVAIMGKLENCLSLHLRDYNNVDRYSIVLEVAMKNFFFQYQL